MSQAHATNPVHSSVTTNDRLALTLFLAVAVHALIILGISFNADKATPDYSPPTLDITLVQHKSPEKPVQADYLAQEHQQGGGTTTEHVREKNDKSGDSKLPGRQQAAPPPSSASKTRSGRTEVLARKKSGLAITTQVEQKKTAKKIDIDELMQRSRVIARLEAQQAAQRQAYAKRPDPKYLYASAQKSVDAAYIRDWTQKVERIGNLNYPEKARKKRLTGNLMIEVNLNPNGKLSSIRLLKSSGKKVLDDAAIRIVRLAAPFAAVPAAVLEGRNELRIVRTWVFTNKNRLFSK
ncbi:MAG TPA: energy transducer TonB [Gammaproteobacteria bacterium]|nr:energy transducer TonB [Gammaproteobacteria bacterium]